MLKGPTLNVRKTKMMISSEKVRKKVYRRMGVSLCRVKKKFNQVIHPLLVLQVLGA